MARGTIRLGLAVLIIASAIAATATDARAGRDPALARALDSGDPAALADTSLPRLASLDSLQRSETAARIAAWPVPRRVAAWAFLQVGTPYALGPLGEETAPDADPLIAFDSTDCAVLNLVSAALAHAGDAGGERAAMALANYRGGVIAYNARFHFTTDRLDGSPYYRDITRAVGGEACLARTVELNLRADSSRWIQIEWSRTRRVVYLPRALGAKFAAWHDQGLVPEAMGVAFVRESTLGDGLDVVHESLLWKGRTLLHASSVTGRVVTLPFAEYLAGPGRGTDGFVLFEYR